MHASTRRQFLQAAAWAVAAGPAARLAAQTRPLPTAGGSRLSATSPAAAEVIDRLAVVARHHVKLSDVSPTTPLQVGNGEFAFSCDVTGLQTLAATHRPAVPLYTMAQWAWHADPKAATISRELVRHDYDVAGRKVPYHHLDEAGTNRDAYDLLRANPHRFSLAEVALELDGRPITPADLGEIDQTLELSTGTLRSKFRVRGDMVQVITVAHPTRDAIAVSIESAALGRPDGLSLVVRFPYATGDWSRPDDWESADRHTTTVSSTPQGANFVRSLDATTYHVRATWEQPVTLERRDPHAFILRRRANQMWACFEFSPRPFDAPAEPFTQVFEAAAAWWKTFWSTGAAIDFAGCTDARATELERRVVLSQYLTAINCAGSQPPQETGLVLNSWHGKHHLEMHWWHGAHFAMWGRFPLLERSLGYYGALLPSARTRATEQGYAGARWPKMTDPAGVDSPSPIGPFLIWQQPHPIYYAELAYRANRTKETLERYAELVDATAQFMESFVLHDAGRDRYDLGPPLIPAQERYDRLTARNPTFELAYWAWGLSIAQKWRDRLGRPRQAAWDTIVQKLSKPLVRDGRYMAIDTEPFLVDTDHPSFLQAFGFLPKTHLIDEKVMLETAKWTMKRWKWNTAWGWDFPVLAQTAARVGDPELAVDALMIESVKNTFAVNGHNPQRDDLPVYLPGNGGLLAAIAMMAGGWDGGPETPAPGFPKNGRWNVRTEGFSRVI